MRINLLFAILALLVPSGLLSQQSADSFSDILEEIAQSLEVDGALDYNTALEQLYRYAEHPLDINSDDLADFMVIGILSSAHASSLRLYIEQNGPLISIYELQAVPGFDADLINRIRPFIRVRGDLSDARQPLSNLILTGDNEVFLRWGQVVQDQKGFLPNEDGTIPFEGDKQRLYLRYRHLNENRISYGVTVEKDPGEALFNGSNQRAFDFQSYHFFLNRYRSWIPQVAIGDYVVNLGQGLIMHTGFAVGKSVFVTQIKKGGFTLRPFTSVNEFDFLRGAAVTINPARHWQFTVFGSHRNLDGNVNRDTIDTGSEVSFSESFSSIQLSGLHRTTSEIEDEGQVSNDLVGGNLKFSKGRFEAGVNALYQTFSQPFLAADQPYNTFRFSGTSLTNISLDYTYILRNLHFFGETAYSDNGAIATINGLLLTLHRNADVAILNRRLPRNFHTVRANSFGETQGGSNENGTYFGIELRPLERWTVSAYLDFWKHPWLRFNVDAPSNGNEQLIRVTYRKKRHHVFYVQYRNEIKERNLTGNEGPVDILVNHRRRQFRAHMSHSMPNGIELRNRVELSWYDQETFETSRGFMAYQDVIYRPLSSDFDVTARIAYFDTDSFDARIYAYENDLINQFYIPAYFYRGMRYYLNLSYRGVRDLVLQFRIAHTELRNRDVISSGNNAIQGNGRTDLKAQLIYRW